MESMPGAGKALLQIENLSVDLLSASPLPVISGASFEIHEGEIAGLFGESGCGKTTLAMALLGLLPAERYRVTGSARWEGRELTALAERDWERLRGARIAMVFQDPLLSLNPVMRVREQIAEAIRAHEAVENARVEALFGLVGLADAARIGKAYPHELSGGERQRVAIALALACRPALIIADEPFTALDAPRVVELSALLGRLRAETGASFLLIDHSPAVLARVAGRLLVMYAGRVVESGPRERIMEAPLHPYTAGLLRCVPRLGRALELAPVPGNPPGLSRAPGCAFEPRCGDRMPRCAAEAPDEYSVEGRRVRCFKYAG
jgi:oligopeptide/dipeptide ABC transporter ATP-binding protein